LGTVWQKWGSRNPEAYRIQLIDTGTWAAHCTFDCRLPPSYASFFRDTGFLLVHTFGPPDGTEYLIIDPARRHVVQAIPRAMGSPYLFDGTGAVADSIVVSVEKHWFTRKTLDGRELTRVPEEPSSLTPAGFTYAPASVSLNRSLLLHATGGRLALRECDTLAVRWVTTLREDREIRALAISTNGEWAAALLAEPKFNDPKCEISVIRGSDGQITTSFPVQADHVSPVLAISRDGKQVAFGIRQRTPAMSEEYDLIIGVHELQPNRMVAQLSHDRVARSSGPMDTYFSRDAIRYSPDGRFIFTTGRTTKVWATPGQA
jgi:hypothetical protein